MKNSPLTEAEERFEEELESLEPRRVPKKEAKQA